MCKHDCRAESSGLAVSQRPVVFLLVDIAKFAKNSTSAIPSKVAQLLGHVPFTVQLQITLSSGVIPWAAVLLVRSNAPPMMLISVADRCPP